MGTKPSLYSSQLQLRKVFLAATVCFFGFGPLLRTFFKSLATFYLKNKTLRGFQEISQILAKGKPHGGVRLSLGIWPCYCQGTYCKMCFTYDCTKEKLLWKQPHPPIIILAVEGGLRKFIVLSYCTPCMYIYTDMNTYIYNIYIHIYIFI
jgi:hypothetical protein